MVSFWGKAEKRRGKGGQGGWEAFYIPPSSVSIFLIILVSAREEMDWIKINPKNSNPLVQKPTGYNQINE